MPDLDFTDLEDDNFLGEEQYGKYNDLRDIDYMQQIQQDYTIIKSTEDDFYVSGGYVE